LRCGLQTTCPARGRDRTADTPAARVVVGAPVDEPSTRLWTGTPRQTARGRRAGQGPEWPAEAAKIAGLTSTRPSSQVEDVDSAGVGAGGLKNSSTTDGGLGRLGETGGFREVLCQTDLDCQRRHAEVCHSPVYRAYDVWCSSGHCACGFTDPCESDDECGKQHCVNGVCVAPSVTTEAKRGGCAGCAIVPTGPSFSGVLLLIALGLHLWRRRTKVALPFRRRK
jgi:hypothetical protein